MPSLCYRRSLLAAAVRSALRRPNRARRIHCEPLEPRTLLSAPGTGWTLTFDDEFSGSAVDYTKWADYLPWNSSATGDNRFEGGSYVNYMVNRSETIDGVALSTNAFVSGGALHLKTQKTASFTVGSQTFTYTGAMLTTGRSPYRAFSSGYFEIRAQLPTGAGNWPAFWMTNGWPPESDIMEAWPGQPRFHQGLYGMDSTWHDYNDYSGFPSTNWHTFSMEWGPSYQKYYVDNILKYTASGSFVPGSGNPMYLLLNSSVPSGQTGSYSNANDNTLDVDYVRIYNYTATSGPSVTNGGFNVAGSWTFSNASAFIVTGGTIGNTGTGDLHIEAAGEAYQTITGLSPNTTYALLGKAIIGTGTTQGLIGVRNFSSGAGNVSTSIGAAGAWTDGSISFTTGASDTSAVIYCNNPNATKVYFDDMVLVTPTRLNAVADTGTALSTPRGIAISATQAQSAGFWSFSASSSNTALVANNGFAYSGSGSSRTLTITPVSGQSGTTVITLTSTDALGATSTQSFNFTIDATTAPGSPTVASPANASASPVTGTGTLLSVLGADDLGEASLTYIWWVGSKPVGASDPTFSANNSNAAKSTTVTFSRIGTYRFGVQIKDPNGLWTTSAVDVTVAATLSGFTISPSNALVGVSSTYQFAAAGTDQFGAAYAGPFSWSILSGGGSIDPATGFFSAPASAGAVTIKAVSGISSASSTLSVIPLTDELAWYKANTAGTSLADSSGHNNTAPISGTLNSNYSFSSGVASNALHFTSGTPYADLPDGIVAGLSSITIATWVRLDSLTNWSRIFDFGTGTSSNMFLTPDAGGTNALRFAITTSGTGGDQRLEGPALSTGAWYHIAVTLSGSTGTLYVNGLSVATNGTMTLSPASLGTTTQNYLGKSQYVADPALLGYLDDFRIYSRALSPTEVLALARPTITQDPAPAGNPGSMAGIPLTILASDTSAGESALTYTWSLVGANPGTAAFTASGTNAGKNTTVSFSAPGTYTLRATVLNPIANLPTTSSTISVTAALPGDSDLSGVVDLADFNTWFSNVGASIRAYANGDFDLSGTVDLADFNIWFANVGASAPLLAAAPAPTTAQPALSSPTLLSTTVAAPMLSPTSVPPVSATLHPRADLPAVFHPLSLPIPTSPPMVRRRNPLLPDDPLAPLA